MDSVNGAAPKVWVAPTGNGCCIRVVGRGTMQESPAVKDIALRTLRGDPRSVVTLDLSNCTYLDSTFLGCLVDLLRAAGRDTPPRLVGAASPKQVDALLGKCRINKMMPSYPDAPPTIGEWVAVESNTDPSRLTRHVMECHRALAEVDGPMRDVFAKIADQLEQELAKTEATGAG
jgi:anti-anti-sigma regulatory factor